MELKRIKRDLWYRTSAGIGQCLEVGGTFPPSIRMRIMQPIPRGVVSVAPRDVLEEVSAPEKTLAAAAAAAAPARSAGRVPAPLAADLGAALSWTFDGAGEWEAESGYVDADGDVGYTWKIGVCDDGSFAVSESDVPVPALERGVDCFGTLAEAKFWCACEEARLSGE